MHAQAVVHIFYYFALNCGRADSSYKMNNTPSNIHSANVPLKMTAEGVRAGGLNRMDEKMREKKAYGLLAFPLLHLLSSFIPLFIIS